MRLNTRVTLIALCFCLAFSTGLAAILLVRGFNSELNSELGRGLNASGMLSGTLSAAMEAFSSLDDSERVARAVRVAVRYMPGAGLVAVADGKGSLIHDNFPLEMAQLLGLMPETPGRYHIQRFEGGTYQLIRREFEVLKQRFTLFSAWDLGQVYAGARSQAKLAALVIGGMGLLLWVLLSLALRAAFHPLRRLEQAAIRIGAGDFAARAPKAPRSDEVGQLSQAFNHMAQATQQHIDILTRQDAAQKQFIADMAHELKTPVTSMVGYADLMRRSPMDEARQQQALGAIVAQGERLERMGAKLMQLSRLSREEAPAMAWHEAQALFSPALEALSAQALEKGIRINITGGDTLFYGDSDLLITLLQNLLSNAIKASRPGGRILLDARPGEIIVRDEGRGIAPEHLPHLTEAFYMADKSRARSEQGNGLGLALASRIATRYGASLHFESEPEKGTAVRVSFTKPIHP
ncbi:MAG: sensor histidine kinase [Christensenellales bacterium]